MLRAFQMPTVSSQNYWRGSNRLFKVENGGKLMVKSVNLTGGDILSTNSEVRLHPCLINVLFTHVSFSSHGWNSLNWCRTAWVWHIYCQEGVPLESCKDICKSDALCFAIEYNPDFGSGNICEIHTEKITQAASDITSKCSSKANVLMRKPNLFYCFNPMQTMAMVQIILR